ncbi:MAG: hypothetical protein WCO58_01900 [bacterium]
MKRFFFVILLLTIVIPFSLFAQEQDFGITLSSTPEQSLPYLPVTVTVESFSSDLDRATIQWSINGKIVKTGMGIKTISFRAGALGSSTTIVATVATIDGGQFSAGKTIYTTDTDIIWEAVDSYVPPFYKGKALPSDEARVKVVAIPAVVGFGSTTKSKDFIYTWKRNYDTVGDASGAGKASYTFPLDYLNTKEKISVDVGARSGSFSATANTDIVIVKPSINFYQKTADGIIHFEKTIGDNDVLYGGGFIFAAPFGISSKNPLDPILTYVWSSAGDTIETNAKRNILPVGDLNNGVIELVITNTRSLFQEVTKKLTISL